jgi:hypothetical protein
MPAKPKKKSPKIPFTLYGPGEEARAGEYHPGDFLLTHGNNFFDGFIRFGQALRFRGENKKYAWWSHAALIVSKKGDLIEAVGAGVRQAHLSEYRDVEYQLVRLNPALADQQDRDQAVRFAQSCLDQKYGSLTLISIVLSLLTGCKFSFGFEGQEICSGLVSRALERTYALFPHDPSHMMPADLAKYFNVSIGEEKNRRILPRKVPFFKAT